MPIPNAAQSPLVEKGGRISLDWLLYLQNALSWVPAPAHANSPGTQGQVAYDNTYFYICVAKNTWIRVALAGGF